MNTRVKSVYSSLFLTFAVSASAALPQPVLHYRSDAGVTTNAAGQVTGWQNLGTLGMSGDVAVEGTSDITYSATGANGSPSVVFGGTTYLKTAGNVNLGIQGSAGGGCWFVALKVTSTYFENRGLLGTTSDNARFGAFFPTGNTKQFFRCYVNASTSGNKYCDRDMRSGWYLLSLSGWGSNLRPYNGWYSAGVETPDSYACLNSWSAPFSVGNLGSSYSWCNPFVGEIAEIRCYAKALTSSERTAVQMEMGIYSGVKADVTSFKGIELFEADDRAYVNEPASLGFTPGVGPSETLVTSGTSGGLNVSFVNALDSTVETATYLAHDGTTGRYRTWCLAMDRKTTSDTIDLPITLTLDAAAAADLPDEVSVLYRASTTGSWQTLAKGRKDAGGAVTVWLDSWKNGYYRFASGVTAAGNLVLHYRADEGVGVGEGGKVTGWKNLGTLGASGDVAVAEETSDITYSATGANGSPSVVFGGTTYLKTAGNVNLGISGSAGGGCWFVALKVTSVLSGNRGLLGTTSDNARFGAFYPTGSKQMFRCYVNASTTGQKYCDRDMRSGWYLLSLSGWGANLRPYNGWYSADVETPDSYTCLNSWSAPFSVGNLGSSYTWCNPFLGEIAEIRCYDRALSVSERTAVQMEMGIYSGVKAGVTSFSGVELFEAEDRAYVQDGVAFGYMHGLGPTGTPAVSATSGDLKVGYVDDLGTWTGATNTVAYLAHNGLTGLDRVWCLSADSGPGGWVLGNAFAIRFTYQGSLPQGEYRLCRKAGAEAHWTRVGDLIPEDDGTGLTCVLESGWQNGYYRIREKKGLCVIVR